MSIGKNKIKNHWFIFLLRIMVIYFTSELFLRDNLKQNFCNRQRNIK